MDKQLPAEIQRVAAAAHAALQEQQHQQIMASYRRLDQTREQLQRAGQRRHEPQVARS